MSRLAAGKALDGAHPRPEDYIAYVRKCARMLPPAVGRGFVRKEVVWLEMTFPVTLEALREELRDLYRSLT